MNRLLALLLVVLAVASGGLFLVPVSRSQGPPPLTLEAIFHPRDRIDFDGEPPHIIRWLKDGEHYVEQRGGEGQAQQLFRVQAVTGEAEPLYDRRRIQSAFEGLPGISSQEAAELVRQGEFDFSPDESSVLISYQGNLYYYRFSDNRAVQLTSDASDDQVPSLSPDGRAVAFVRNHDLYVVEISSGRETRLTRGGGENRYNGILDWVYQEEIYGRGDFKAHWWSPDSKRVAYLSLDESPVPSFTVIDHIPQHLKEEVTRYPLAGDPNPRVELGVVSLEDSQTRWMGLESYDPADLLIVGVDWHPDGTRLVFQTQNKDQTWLDLDFADPESGQVRQVLRETTPAWVNDLGAPEWLADGSFLWQSERSGWRRLYRYSGEGELLATILNGNWELRSLHGVDEEQGWIYFSGTERSPIGLDVYRVHLDGSGLQRLSQEPGTHQAKFNEQLTRFIDTWSDFTTPAQTRLLDSTGKQVRVIDANPAKELERLQLPAPELVTVPTRDGFEMEAMLIKPPDFDPSRKYPVMSHTYSGPHAPRVVNRWGGDVYLWHQFLAQQGYVIWICDNRTASGKGAVSTWPLHRNFGELELRDLEDGLNWLEQQPWVDGDRIGLWGWSFGGYMTSYALTHSQRFKLGIAGAPVTDWHLYDTVYTERYMGTPQSNPEGYRKSSVLNAAGNLSGKLLIVHGTTDDNVHLQNSIKLIYELQKAGKDFEIMFYPRNRHGFRDLDQIYHMRRLMTRFIKDNL